MRKVINSIPFSTRPVHKYLLTDTAFLVGFQNSTRISKRSSLMPSSADCFIKHITRSLLDIHYSIACTVRYPSTSTGVTCLTMYVRLTVRNFRSCSNTRGSTHPAPPPISAQPWTVPTERNFEIRGNAHSCSPTQNKFWKPVFILHHRPVQNTDQDYPPREGNIFCNGWWVFDALGVQLWHPIFPVLDNGSSFNSKFFATIFSVFCIQKLYTSAFHPQTNGHAERYNRTNDISLLHYVIEHHRDWDHYIEPLTYHIIFKSIYRSHTISTVPVSIHPVNLVFLAPTSNTAS